MKRNEIKIICQCGQKLKYDDVGNRIVECPICKKSVFLPCNRSFKIINTKSILILCLTMFLLGIIWLVKPMIRSASESQTSIERILNQPERITSQERLMIQPERITSQERIISNELALAQTLRRDQMSDSQKQLVDSQNKEFRHRKAKAELASRWLEKFVELKKDKTVDSVILTMTYNQLKTSIEADYNITLDGPPPAEINAYSPIQLPSRRYFPPQR